MINIESNYRFSQSILDKIHAVNAEDPAYAADELVELAEEILQQIAAVGMIQYLKHAPQKEVYNDFLIGLFNSSGHDYNAGPLFRWAANMLKECPVTRSSPRFGFFWEKSGDKEVLSHKVHRLAELRNSVMHGFFVLPPERNVEEAAHIQNLLYELANACFFDIEVDYHFFGLTGFTGNWNITENSDWNKLMSDSPFGRLCDRIVREQQESFWIDENKVFEKGQENLVPTELKEFVKLKDLGAIALWTHPADASNSEELYAAIGNWLNSMSDVFFVGYALHDSGMSYTGNFLMQRLLQVLNVQNKTLSKGKKMEDQIKALRNESKDKKVVVLLQHFHTALFSPLHVSKWANFLFENNIILVALGHHYEYFNGFLNAQLAIDHPNVAPSQELALSALRNYLRFKGPSFERTDECGDVEILEEILANVLKELATGRPIYARRFADQFNYSIEYVHEIFALLHPWVKSSREVFEQDAVDELYGFPSEMTEVTPIYLALGRRDVKLEYQHKVLSL